MVIIVLHAHRAAPLTNLEELKHRRDSKSEILDLARAPQLAVRLARGG
jgi:hypothetical protein